jgi:hypothetical protein
MNLFQALKAIFAIDDYLPGIVWVKGRRLVGSNIIAFVCADPRVRFLATISRAFRRNNIHAIFRAGPVGLILNDATRASLLAEAAPTIAAMCEHFRTSTVVIGAHDDCKADRWPAEEHKEKLKKACEILAAEPMFRDKRMVGLFTYGPDNARQKTEIVYDSKKRIISDLVLDINGKLRPRTRRDSCPF